MNPLAELAAAGLTSPELVQQALAAQQNNQLNALRGIASLRKLGFADDQIFAMPSSNVQTFGQPGADPMRLAGGYGLLGPMVNMAGITSSYKLGRAGLAQQMLDQDFQQALARSQLAARPFNTVQALDFAGRTGDALPIGRAGALPSMKPAQIGESSKYRGIIDQIISGDTKAMAGGGTLKTRGRLLMMEDRGDGTYELRALAGEEGPERVDVTPMARGGRINVNVPDNPYGKEIAGLTSSKPGTSQKGLDQYNRMGGKGGGSSLDLAYRMRSGTKLGGKGSLGGKGKGLSALRGLDVAALRRQMGSSPVQRGQGGGGEGIATGPGSMAPELAPSNAQRQSANLLSGAVRPLTNLAPEFQSLLAGGQIPGTGTINNGQFNSLRPDLRDTLLDLWMSTGLISSPEEAYWALRAGTPMGF